jgi:hypothetical protein
MATNQNDRSVKKNSSSTQKSQDSGRRKETDPNNPTAGKQSQSGSNMGSQQKSGSSKNPGKSGSQKS